MPDRIAGGVTIGVDSMRFTAVAPPRWPTGLVFDRRWLDERRPAYPVPGRT